MHIASNTWKNFSHFSDQEVWDQLRSGNHLALEYLYRTYGNDLFNFGMKLYGKYEWVQDTLHELYVDLWNQRQRLTAVTSIKKYLFKAFKYKLQRHHSQEKRWLYPGTMERLPEMKVELPLENQIIAVQFAQEQQMKLVQAIEKLPTRQKEVLHLLFDEGMNYEEVAEIMEINIRSVYTLAWKGISALKKLFIAFIVLLAPIVSAMLTLPV